MKKLVFALCFLIIAGGVFAQKVKYKDLYPLLSVKKYDDAEPFLKQFLEDPKNAEKYPNALLQMAFIYHEKALENDVLKSTELFQHNADSAISYYQLSLKHIDDREVRKNDEYYKAYQRRDIRTGKFGINVGDVQFDIENKIEELKERKEKVATLADYFDKSQTAYDSAQFYFSQIKEKHATEKRLLLRLSEDEKDLLNKVAASYRRAVENFESFKNTLSGIGKTDYSQELTIKEVLDYEQDGVKETDMLADNVEFWNYGKWAAQVEEVHENEIIPLFSDLVAFDKQLESLSSKVYADSTSVISGIPQVGSLAALSKLKDYDSNPMPEMLFNYKISALEFHSHSIENHDYKDSADLIYQLDVLKYKEQKLKEMDSLISSLLALNIGEEAVNYASFVEAQHRNEDGLIKYLEDQKNYITTQENTTAEALELSVERARWLISASDSIPLFKPDSLALSKYAPIVLDSVVTAGLLVDQEETTGYLANITPNRIPTVSFTYALDSIFSKMHYERIESKSIALLNEGGLIYFVLLYIQPAGQDVYTATAIRANDEGLLWANKVELSTAPGQLSYNVQTDEIIINYDLDNLNGTEVVGGKLVLAKDGSVMNP